jgi:hypothetical protein
LTVDPSAIHPIDRGTIATLAHMLAAPEAIDRETMLDPGETIEQTARNAGRLTLCFARESEQPRLILLEDVSRSMERWPTHATQLARALEAQGQPVERRYTAGDPLQISERRSVDGCAARFEEATAGARVVIVSEGAYFDPEAARTVRHARALDDAIWLQPRPAELWRAGARWLNTCAFIRTLGAVPSSLALPAAMPAEWRPPRPQVDVDETADAWRSALGDDAYLAFAATALLDLAASWSAALVWALISDGIIAPPWRQFERIWDLPELAVLPGGRIRLAPELCDRLLADVRGERPELVQRVAAWIDARLAAAIEAAGEGSLGAAVGEVYRDRVARAAGLDGAGGRVWQLAQRGLSSVIAAQVSGDERAAWQVRDPQAAWPARLRGPLLGLALLGTAGFAIASAVAPAQHGISRSVPNDAGVTDTPSDGAADAPIDAYHGDPGRGARVAQRAGCVGCQRARVILCRGAVRSAPRRAQPRQRRGEVGGQRRLEAQPRAGDRVIELEQRGVQRLAAERRCDRGQWARRPAVQRIAEQRPAVVGGVDPDLVGAAGLQPEPDQRRAGEWLDHGPVGDRRLAGGDPGREPLAIGRVTAVQGAQRAGGRRRRRGGDAEVLADDATGLATALGGERRAERRVRAIALGDDHRAAGVLVEPVDDAGAERAADPAEVPAMKQQRVDQRAAGMSGRGMHDQAGRLVDGDQVGVLVQHGERQVLGDQLDRLGGRDVDLDRVAGAHPLAGLGDRRAMDPDLRAVDQPLDPGARQRGDDRGDQRVDPLAGTLGVDGEPVVRGDRRVR